MKKILIWAGIILGVPFALFALLVIAVAVDMANDQGEQKAVVAATEATPKPTPKATPKATKKPKPKATFSDKAYAKEVEEHFNSALLGTIEDMCDGNVSWSHWSCYYEGIEASGPGMIRVNLVTPGGLSKQQVKELSNTTATHWFNFVGEKFPKLDTIVVNVNGIDYNNYR